MSELEVRDPEAILADLGFAIPETPFVGGLYVPATRAGDIVYSSGAVPVWGGQVTHVGHVGGEVGLEDAQAAARIAVVNALGSVRTEIGSLRRVLRILKLTGYVASAPGFSEQHLVMNAASQLLIDAFGDSGRGVRTAVGVAELPLGVPVEVELVVLLR